MKPIRLSPSGPIITSDAGAPLELGTGARLRLSEGKTTVFGTGGAITTTNQVIGQVLSDGTVPADVPLVVSLGDGVSIAKNYRATLLCDVVSQLTSANVTVTLSIQTSPDGGTTWGTVASNTHVVSGGALASGTVPAGARQVRCDATLRSGADFGLAPTSTSLKVRGQIKASANSAALLSHGTADETGDGSVLLQLEELF